jgi:hypothetical protein
MLPEIAGKSFLQQICHQCFHFLSPTLRFPAVISAGSSVASSGFSYRSGSASAVCSGWDFAFSITRMTSSILLLPREAVPSSLQENCAQVDFPC